MSLIDAFRKILATDRYSRRAHEAEFKHDLRVAIKPEAVLIDIRRQGRLNIFTFRRGAELYNVETMGLMSDNINEWKRALLDE